MPEHDPARPLREFQPSHEFFVGIDSDGCAFDTMEIKQKECFIPNTIKFWELQPISKYVRETVEFVNLYSKWRGINRWPALTRVFDLLAERDEVRKRGAKLPNYQPLKDWIARETKLSNSQLRKEIDKTRDPVLERGWNWSEAVNRTIAEVVKGLPPFPYVRESLGRLAPLADMIVVSQTPTEALVREWTEHDIARYAAIIAGQEMGTKAEHLQFATTGRYRPGRVLMIGDALGDLEAAQANHALFFPINPGQEEDSWQRFCEEGLDRFTGGTFAGDYERALIADFGRHLPETPPWKKTPPHAAGHTG